MAVVSRLGWRLRLGTELGSNWSILLILGSDWSLRLGRVTMTPVLP